MIEINKSTSRVFARLGQSGAAFGVGLIQEAEKKDNIVVLSADMAKPAGLSKFASLHPEKFYNIGIAEQNLIGVAAGVANEGFRVIASAQACFLSMRCYEQVRQYSGYMGLPIIYLGVSAGFGLTFFGNTHYALEDISLYRSIPGMTVISPSDPSQAIKAMEAALGANQAVYIRCTGVPGLPPIYKEDFEFKIGKGITIQDGSDIVVISSGSITRNVLDAVEALTMSHKLSFKIIDMHTISPIDKELLNQCMTSKLWITVEEHFVSGGLGSVVAEFLSDKFEAIKPNLLRLGVQDKFSVPGDYNYLIETNELDAQGIIKQISKAIRRVF
ncbi:transketolase [Gammaproteobacteria bacterium]|nr:transketolase [Gammaproteobacteria bacterium]MDC1325985.1 transketolase [Gammaproteobacteria bacterium]